MAALELLRRAFAHLEWADAHMLAALTSESAPSAAAEYAHFLAAEAVWLARLQQREPHLAVWPVMSPDELHRLATTTHAGYQRYLDGLEPASLATRVRYRNSAGQPFETEIGDILLHVVLHGQYHRGKVNLLLRQAGMTPAPCDYIAFVRCGTGS